MIDLVATAWVAFLFCGLCFVLATLLIDRDTWHQIVEEPLMTLPPLAFFIGAALFLFGLLGGLVWPKLGMVAVIGLLVAIGARVVMGLLRF